MRITTATLLLAGALALPMPVLAQSGVSAAAKPKATTAPHTTATHAARGVVKSMDSNTLVISRGGKKKSGDMTFTLSDTTQRSGTISVGSPVSVRYQKAGKTDIATAITAEQTVQKTAHNTTGHKG